MTTATKPAYTPQITEVLPLTKYQRALAAAGFRGFWVEANSKRVVKGVRIVRYLLTLMGDGYIKCPCEARKWNPRKDCCHIEALREHLAGERRFAEKNATVVRQAERVAAKADRALLVDRTPEVFSIYADTPRERRYQTLEEQCNTDGYPSGDYYQHAYR